MSEETKAETKEETKKETKHKVPAPHVAPVEATHRLKKEINPKTGQPYVPEKFTTQQMYTMLRAAETNGMPVKHFHKDGSVHKAAVRDDESGELLTRPGFDFDELTNWWQNRPARGSKKTETDGEKTESRQPTDAELSDEEELAGDDGDLVEAE
jgi:hypothetical protein